MRFCNPIYLVYSDFIARISDYHTLVAHASRYSEYTASGLIQIMRLNNWFRNITREKRISTVYRPDEGKQIRATLFFWGVKRKTVEKQFLCVHKYEIPSPVHDMR